MVHALEQDMNGAYFFNDTPHIHVHYFEGKSLDSISVVEICCHGCHLGILLVFQLPASISQMQEGLPDPTLVAFRRSFQTQHKHCKFPEGEHPCSTKRRKRLTVDLTPIQMRGGVLC